MAETENCRAIQLYNIRSIGKDRAWKEGGGWASVLRQMLFKHTFT